MNRRTLEEIDSKIIRSLQKAFLPAARLSIFIIYFWFGALKVFALSPASPMVLALLERTLPFMDPSLFLKGFGVYEMIIGIAFLIPRFEREAIALLVPHLICTLLPLFLLSALVWTAPFVPTMEGQYIIKNLLIAALAIG
ncbi:MAG: hypothetical protein JWL80_253, partial [Parcubacteria group bacterium]|nr:hypothetical protein [Parcubacteria group bacterium]